MGAISVDLDAGLRFRLGLGVSADMPAPFDDQDPLAELAGHAFSNRQAEESRADDDQVIGGH